jgi:hypothetical protein
MCVCCVWCAHASMLATFGSASLGDAQPPAQRCHELWLPPHWLGAFAAGSAGVQQSSHRHYGRAVHLLARQHPPLEMARIGGRREKFVVGSGCHRPAHGPIYVPTPRVPLSAGHGLRGDISSRPPSQAERLHLHHMSPLCRRIKIQRDRHPNVPGSPDIHL